MAASDVLALQGIEIQIEHETLANSGVSYATCS
ncbi:hypothetical protein SAMN05421505_1112 [Sinosporangium album]|uniref:SapB/AmfS family lantipeptide n=1 Tax=Sinosporangium album TaxID=504805 RepID=A0A1G7ZCM0_9ACTN|nr:SapB/AmfS family lantipeptide [Sinosporangium album]SDH06375.1 hypothetical protein SAMN05421505_1112 [Sinosporangium album]